MAELLKIEVTKRELSEGILPQNHVLCEMFYTSEGAKTKSGIVYGVLPDLTYADADNPDDDSSHAADLAETCARVVKCPQKLYFDPEDEKGMNWETDMALEVGDKVWTNPIESQNATCLICEGKIYKILPYSDLYCAKRWTEITGTSGGFNQSGYFYDGKVVMLNGFVLCRLKNKESISELDVTSEDKVYKDRGIVTYLGEPNKRYRTDDHIDFIDLKVGDEVLFDKKYAPFLLERQKYASRFDENNLYWVVPRRRIFAVINREG